MFSIDRVAVFESINKFLNFEKSYFESIETLNTYGIDAIEKVLSDKVKRCLNTSFAKISVIVDNSDASRTLSEMINCSFTFCTLNVLSFDADADALIVRFSKN